MIKLARERKDDQTSERKKGVITCGSEEHMREGEKKEKQRRDLDRLKFWIGNK